MKYKKITPWDFFEFTLNEMTKTEDQREHEKETFNKMQEELSKYHKII